MIRWDIKRLLTKAVQRKFGVLNFQNFSIEIPENPMYGDYATNVALILGQVLKKNPVLIAEDLVEELRGELTRNFSKMQVAPPGFINFWLQDKILEQEFGCILKKKNKYGKPDFLRKLPKINLEFISANPTGPLTIGNGRGAFLGDALARVLSFYGHKITREYYINDARASTQVQELGKTILGRGQSYKGEYTNEIRKRLQKRFFRLDKMSEIETGYAAAQEIQKDNKKIVAKLLKIKIDAWFSEEKLYKNQLVKKLLKELDQKSLVYTQDGALWFRASQFGDSEDRVAIRSSHLDRLGRASSTSLAGAPTYFLPDVAYHREKLTVRKFDRVIDILGADHHGTFPRVLAGLRALGLDTSRVTVIFTQIVRLVRKGVEVKVSKRKGQYVALEELIGEVGLDAARYFFLEKTSDTHMNFDLDLAKERSMKNPVYYIQYAHARISSVFRKTKNQRIFNFSARGGSAFGGQFSIFKLLNEKEELDLIKRLIQFPEVVEDTVKDYQVHRLTHYAFELARTFHNFYEKHRVMTDDKKLTQARLLLIKATQVILQNTLDLLGISAPKKM